MGLEQYIPSNCILSFRLVLRHVGKHLIRPEMRRLFAMNCCNCVKQSVANVIFEHSIKTKRQNRPKNPICSFSTLLYLYTGCKSWQENSKSTSLGCYHFPTRYIHQILLLQITGICFVPCQASFLKNVPVLIPNSKIDLITVLLQNVKTFFFCEIRLLPDIDI